jgi:hypothetical protein
MGLLAGVSIAAASVVPSGRAEVRPAKPARSLSEARLVGYFNVVERVIGVHNFGSKVGESDEDVYSFIPLCGSGACSARVKFDSRTVTMRLIRSGAVYKGSGTAKLAQCQLQPVAGTITLQLRVTTAAWIGEAWRAKSWIGTSRFEAPDVTWSMWHCPAGSITKRLHATLEEDY